MSDAKGKGGAWAVTYAEILRYSPYSAGRRGTR